VIDRIAYSSYGEATRTLRSDVNGDGFVNQSDYTGIIRPRNGATIGTAAYVVEADLDRNGVINQLDYDICIADDGKSSSGGVGEAGLFSRGVRNSIGYCGYVYNEDSGLYTVRFRTYSPTLGRWLERDPAGYVDGANLYEYVRSNPIRFNDRLGWQAEDTGDGEASPEPEVNPTSDQIPQCKDDKGNPISLQFDGTSLKGNDFCAMMVSGKPDSSVTTTYAHYGTYIETTLTFDYSKQRQRMRDVGPLPEGCFYLRSDQENSSANTKRHKLLTRAWGDYDWPLAPYPDTDVNDTEGQPKSNFFLHGGGIPGSKGCADLCNGADTDFKGYMDKVRKNNGKSCYIKMCVSYSKSTATVVKKAYRPFMECAPRCSSESPWMVK
jgi:RHS repeat-associated protein